MTEIVAKLAQPGDRTEAALQLAARFNGKGAIALVRDEELGIPLPALGFPQTLPSTVLWRKLVDEALANKAGIARGTVCLPEPGEPQVEALAIADVAVFCFWPAEAISDLEPLRPYLPLLASVFGPERQRLVIEAQLLVANNTAKEVHFLASQLDTARHQLEKRVNERTAELRASIRELEGFTYSVSHDLRAPLRAVYSTARILEEDFQGQVPPEAAVLLRIQADRARTLGQLIDDLLQLSRLSRSELQRTEVDLTTQARQALDAIFLRYPHRAEAFDVCIEPGLFANADPRLLRLALENLLENAVKFSPHGGKITVGQRSGDFFVRDEGVGFDDKYSAKIFGAFERLVTSEEFPGTGIGLANVQRIVDRHGGKVWATSVPQKGTTVYFTLEPVANHADESPAVHEESRNTYGRVW